MQTIGTPPRPSPREPDEATLCDVLRRLEAAGDLRGVLRLSIGWRRAAGRAPPREAVLAEARALAGLRLLDRAWAVLQPLAEAGDADAIELMARVLAERGWAGRARQALRRLEAQAPERAARLELPEPPRWDAAEARAIEAGGSAAERLALAERYLALGSAIRARQLLEALARERPEDPRVGELLWAARGEFDDGRALGDLLDDLLAGLEEWEAGDRTEGVAQASVDGPEPATMEVRRPGTGAGDEGTAFPHLFRGGPTEDAPTADDGEVTVAARVEAIEAAGTEGETTERDLEPVDDEAGDTQVLQVIGAAGDEDGEPPEPEVPPRPVDLRALGRRAEPRLEEEDEDLVVLKPHRPPPEPPPTPPRHGPIEVVEKIPVPDVPVDDEPAGGPGTRRGGLRLAFVAAVFGLLLVAVALGLVRLVSVATGDRVIAEVRGVLATADARAIGDLADRLAREVEAGRSPLGVRAAELAVVRAVLWDEYTGSARDRDAAREALALAGERGGPEGERALARALLALSEGDARGALDAVAPLDGADPEVRRLRARALLALGDGAGALEAWRPGGAAGLRHGLLDPLVLAAAGRPDEARRRARELAASAGGNVEALLLLLERDWWEGGPEHALARVDRLLEERREVLSPRQRGRALAVRARLLGALGRAEEARRAWRQAQAADPTHAAWLVRVVALDLEAGRGFDAARLATRCSELHPLDPGCHRAEVRALLDLDRVVEARARVDAWRGGEGAARGEVLLAEGRFEEARDAARSALEAGAAGAERGRWLYVLGSALGKLATDPALAGRALAQAARLLGESKDPLDAILAVRADSARLVHAPAGVSREERERIVRAAARDPVALVHVARYYEARGRNRLADRRFREAVATGPENGLALYWRGHFEHWTLHRRAGDIEAWRRYLRLQPSGVRRLVVDRELAADGDD